MLEETGTVIATDQHHIWVETQSRSACSHCGAGSCSTSVIARLFGVKRNRLRLPNHLDAVIGQQVVVGIPDQVLVAVSARAYLLPLLGMLGAAALAGGMQAGDAMQALIALIGLFIGLALSGWVSETEAARERYTPQLLRLCDSPAPFIELTALTRNRS